MATRTKVYTFKVTLPVRRFGGEMAMAGFFDMLRYEQARVVDWDRDNTGTVESPTTTWTLTLRGERYTPDRWSSFGLTAKLTGEDWQ